MTDDTPEYEPESGDTPAVFCRHFILSHTVWHDRARPDDFLLGRIVIHLHPAGGVFPTTFNRLFAYGQLFGMPGEYEFRIRAVRVESAGYDEEVEQDIGRAGLPLEWRPNRPLVVTDENYADWFAIPLTQVTIPMPGVYEFQLFLDGASEPLARERVFARGGTMSASAGRRRSQVFDPVEPTNSPDIVNITTLTPTPCELAWAAEAAASSGEPTTMTAQEMNFIRGLIRRVGRDKVERLVNDLLQE